MENMVKELLGRVQVLESKQGSSIQDNHSLKIELDNVKMMILDNEAKVDHTEKNIK